MIKRHIQEKSKNAEEMGRREAKEAAAGGCYLWEAVPTHLPSCVPCRHRLWKARIHEGVTVASESAMSPSLPLLLGWDFLCHFLLHFPGPSPNASQVQVLFEQSPHFTLGKGAQSQ